MQKPRILRKRYIPFETVDISADEMLLRNEELLVTKWNVIRPRSDFSRGISYTFLKEGYKVSRFYNSLGEFIYWYCDILDITHDKENDTYTMADLLVDIKLMTDGTLKVLDSEELAEALESGLITQEQACRSLRRLDKLLNMIYEGNFPPKDCLEKRYWED